MRAKPPVNNPDVSEYCPHRSGLDAVHARLKWPGGSHRSESRVSEGDHVRVLIETNADGYLYVFNTTDGGKPMMIYPDPELDEAGNYFQSHVPFEIPSSLAAEERLKWFTFDDNSGAEKLYFVFTREPLATVPIEDDLITYCRENSCAVSLDSGR